MHGLKTHKSILCKPGLPNQGYLTINIEMNYLTEEEKKMPNEMRLLQLALGLESCRTRKDAHELLKEAQEIAVEDYKQKVREALDKIKPVTQDGFAHGCLRTKHRLIEELELE